MSHFMYIFPNKPDNKKPLDALTEAVTRYTHTFIKIPEEVLSVR